MSFLLMKPIYLPKKEVKQNNCDAAWKNQKPYKRERERERERSNPQKKSQIFFTGQPRLFLVKKNKVIIFPLYLEASLHNTHTHTLFWERSLFWFFFLSLKTQKRKQSWKCQKPLHLTTHPPQLQLLLLQFRLSLLLRFLLPISKSLLGFFFFFFFFNFTQNSTTPAMELGSGSAEHNIRGVPTHGGRYVQYNIYGNLFEVSRKYVPPIRPVGRGAYGIVWYGF